MHGGIGATVRQSLQVGRYAATEIVRAKTIDGDQDQGRRARRDLCAAFIHVGSPGSWRHPANRTIGRSGEQ